jgi:hypothetical protein
MFTSRGIPPEYAMIREIASSANSSGSDAPAIRKRVRM